MIFHKFQKVPQIYFLMPWSSVSVCVCVCGGGDCPLNNMSMSSSAVIGPELTTCIILAVLQNKWTMSKLL